MDCVCIECGNVISQPRDGWYASEHKENCAMVKEMYIDGHKVGGKPTLHEPDYDLGAYMRFVGDKYATPDNIKGVLATVPGMNDEDSWFWIVKLKPKHAVDGKLWLLIEASCDYTGWDCQAGGTSQPAKTAYQAAKLAPEVEHGRHIQKDLIDQLRGKLPYGVSRGYNEADEWGRY